MFLQKALEHISTDKSLKKSHSELKDACEKGINFIKQNFNPDPNANGILPPKITSEALLSDEILLNPFQLACETKISKLAVVSIDCLQKLIAYGHVPNDLMNINNDKRLIEKIGQNTDEAVQLQIIKALLTIITSSCVEVHEQDLLLVMKTVYNIYMASKAPVNQTTARAALNQMLSVIFQRMETSDVNADQNNKTYEEIVRENTPETVPESKEDENESLSKAEDDSNAKKNESDVPEPSSEERQIEGSKSTLSNQEKKPDSSSSPLQKSKTSSKANGSQEEDLMDYNFVDVYHKDAFLVFRTLCILSSKKLEKNNLNDPKSHEFRSKVLSLQLLLSIFQMPGANLRTNEVFIGAIKQLLFLSLTKNGLSAKSDIFELSLGIFLSLLSYYKLHLKMQIEVFFKEVFLYFLEATNVSYDHKFIVLEALERICNDPQCIVDLYLNYDCDISMTNIFEKLVVNLAKIAQGRKDGGQTMNLSGSSSLIETKNVYLQEKTLRQKGLVCLVNILKSMVKWSNDLYIPLESQSFLGSEALPSSVSGGLSSNGHYELQSLQSNGTNSVKGFSEDDPSTYEERKAQKDLYEMGISKFNQGYFMKGIKILQDNGLLGESAQLVAAFLHDEDRLNKIAVGDFLGENSASTLEIMYAFVDNFKFNDMDIVAALRLFLADFKLPGEAQKIDRIMEKFAARYCQCNPHNKMFSSADTAYVLAFSIIMLTTDLHSNQIKQANRMTKNDYIRMNRGINESDDLPEEYLGKIYDEIANCGIKLSSTKVSNPDAKKKETSNEKTVNESIVENCDTMVTATHSEHVRPMFKLAWTPFLAAFSVGIQDNDDLGVAKNCLEGMRNAVRIACIFHMEIERDAYVQALARFTLLLTTNNKKNFFTRMNSSQQTAPEYSSSQINFPINLEPTPPESMKQKNIESIKALISVAQTDGNYLKHSWLEILRCISQLESAQLVTTSSMSLNTANNINEDSHQPSNQSGTSENGPLYAGSLAAANVDSKKAAVLHEMMCETGSESVVVGVDKVFAGSVRLDGEAIVDFVKALCLVSREELSLEQPRIFSLQKLVEISYYNMGRIRLQWSRIWEHIGAHFTNAGKSENIHVAIFVLDSLRQLSAKLIEKGELPNFHFQKEFLRPFVNILEKDRLIPYDVEDMVVRCVSQLVHSQNENIHSGWGNIFNVFQNIATTKNEQIIDMGFESCSFVISNLLAKRFEYFTDSFPVLVKALADFACNLQFQDISMEAIRQMRICAKLVAEQGESFIIAGTKNRQKTLAMARDSTKGDSANIEAENIPTICGSLTEPEDYIWINGWMPVLCELFRIINSCKLDVRTRGLTVFFEIIKTYGSQFREKWWNETFNVIFCVFTQIRSDDIVPEIENSKYHSDLLERRLGIWPLSDSSSVIDPLQRRFYNADRHEWMNTTCNHTLYSVVDVFTQYYDQLHSIFLNNLYSQLYWCCLQDHEQLARSGTSCLETLIMSNGKKFTDSIWAQTTSLILKLFKETIPHELMTWKPPIQKDTDKPTNPHQYNETFVPILIRCIVQNELIQAVDNIVFGSAKSKEEDQSYLTLWTMANENNKISSETLDSLKHKYKNDGRKWLLSLEMNEKIDNIPRTFCLSLRDESAFDRFNENGCLSNLTRFSNFDDRRLYDYLKPEQLFAIAETLLDSNDFARRFNSNNEQRNIIWEAGFKLKSKPNLVNQEVHSLSCALRILFLLSSDPNQLQRKAEDLLNVTIQKSLQHYFAMENQVHKTAFQPVVVLILTRVLCLNEDHRFRSFVHGRTFTLISHFLMFSRQIHVKIEEMHYSKQTIPTFSVITCLIEAILHRHSKSSGVISD